MTLSANITSKSVFDQQGCRALTFALARLSCYLVIVAFIDVCHRCIVYNCCLCFSCEFRPALLSSQSWPVQGQSQLLTVTQPAAMSTVSVQLSRSHESLMQSTVPRPLTFSQQIRPQQPQQLAVLTQKQPELSSVTRHRGQSVQLVSFVH